MYNQKIKNQDILIPRPYQVEMIEWMWTMRRCWNTDWPGLGKTLMAAEAAELPCLIVAPSHLIGQWGDFLEKQYPDTRVSAAFGTRKNRDNALKRIAEWYVVNYEMLHSYHLPTGLKTIIFDESHHLRNRKPLKSKAAFALVKREAGCRVYMLSASPMWKSIDDIWMQGHILLPKIFNSYYDFVKMFCVTDDTPYGPKVIGLKKSMREEFESIISPVMKGRTYKDVGRYLPEVISNVVRIDLPKVLRDLYNKIKLEYSIQFKDAERNNLLFNSAGMTHALRQITAFQGKIDAIHEIIEDNGLPTVVCFWYRDHAEKMFNALPKNSAVLLDGELDPKERQKRAMEAQNTGKHIVCTQASLTEGVNLSKYRQVIVGEQNYTPGSNFQFLSRVVRDRNDGGTDNDPVLVHYVQVKRTIDEIIYKTSLKREASIKDVIKESLL